MGMGFREYERFVKGRCSPADAERSVSTSLPKGRPEKPAEETTRSPTEPFALVEAIPVREDGPPCFKCGQGRRLEEHVVCFDCHTVKQCLRCTELSAVTRRKIRLAQTNARSPEIRRDVVRCIEREPRGLSVERLQKQTGLRREVLKLTLRTLVAEGALVEVPVRSGVRYAPADDSSEACELPLELSA